MRGGEVSWVGRGVGVEERGEQKEAFAHLSCEDAFIFEKNWGLLSPYASEPGAFNFTHASGGYAGQGPRCDPTKGPTNNIS